MTLDLTAWSVDWAGLRHLGCRDVTGISTLPSGMFSGGSPKTIRTSALTFLSATIRTGPVFGIYTRTRGRSGLYTLEKAVDGTFSASLTICHMAGYSSSGTWGYFPAHLRMT